ncbi:MAG: fibronectin type III domain-containing protein [Candidatus Wolfebacteria bacterium GW2011_GWB1_47_1]|uniref:Fibronectin type III domain-containing protein n=1 Tax=Candidatus Wolfebacteria bacterium GW2011_GWB1_47_1 TaxID=1619007 RepID=A0A0G4ARK8_9BACT|nr:MAG: fibronectin type III domain-containing protein [Candidatus Wolfebacteria bacterium GW2011_GWB1_47_1]
MNHIHILFYQLSIIHMTTIIKKITVVFLALFMVAGMAAPSATALAATFNNDSRDYATLQVSNYTRNPGSNSNWSNSVSASAGEVVSFLVYYHNTASDTASNTRIRVQLPSGAFTNRTVTGEVFSLTTSTVNGSASINLSSNQTLTFIPGSVSWYPNQSTVSQTLPNGQNGSEIVSSNGVLIGDIAGGWGAQGYIVFRAQVSSGSQSIVVNSSTNARSPYVTTRAASSVSRSSVLLRGAINPNGTLTTGWFEYGVTPSLGRTTIVQPMGQSQYSNAYSSVLSGLQAGTTYYYRAAAQNSYGTARGHILSFTTSGGVVAQIAPRTIVQRTATVRSEAVTIGDDALIILDPSIDVVRPNAGDTITYTIIYKNKTNTALRDAQLSIVLPEDIVYREASVDPTSVTDGQIAFNLGTIAARESGSIDITLMISEAVRANDSFSINALLDYANGRGDMQTVSAYLVFLVNDGTAGLASLSSVFGGLLDNWFIDLVLGLIIGFGIYHFFVRQKDEVLLVK